MRKIKKNIKEFFIFITISLLIFTCSAVFSQSGAAINTTGTPADQSAMLDVSSTNSGILIPRLTKLQRSGISQPAEGLMIYQTDDTTGFWYFNGTNWKQIGTASGPAILAGTSAGNTLYWNGTNWVESSNIYNIGGSVGIGTNNPEPTALIDMSSTTKGALIPRMTTAQRNAIVNPAEGLQIFNTSTKCFEYYAYGFWQTDDCAICFYPDDAGLISGSIDVCQGDNGVVYSTPVINYATNYIWSYSGTGITINGTSETITINFSSTSTSGNLSVKGNNHCGDGIVSQNLSILVNSIPVTTTDAGTNSTQTSITWNWNTVSGATGYKFNTVNNYSTATDNGTNTTYTQNGLTCNTYYTLYVWAYNNCGNSSFLELSETTSSCNFVCGNNVIFLYNNNNVTYGTLNGQNSTCWLDRNLGALTIASAYNHTDSYGDLFQWGRLDDGHQLRTSVKTSLRSNNIIPGHANFIYHNSSPYDWLITQNSSLWQGASGINNPCPIGWRLPTSTELDNERSGWTQKNFNGAFISSLKLTAAGYRNISGDVLNSGTRGLYWSSTAIGTTAYYLNFTSSIADIRDDYHRVAGFSVRCIKDY